MSVRSGRRCRKCGMENPPFAKTFCVQCGTELPRSRLDLKAALIVALVSILIVFAILGIAWNLNTVGYTSTYTTYSPTASTTMLQTQAADFELQAQSSTLTIYRTKSVTTELTLLAINGFDQSVSLSSIGTPNGLTANFASNPISPGPVSLSLTANQLAPNGTYPITITATYSPPQSTPIVHQVTIMVTIADFYIQVAPTTTNLQPGSTTSLTVTLTLEKGFVDPITINVVDLPQGATYTLTNSNPTILAGPGTTTITLQIKAPLNIKVGTYSVLIQASGAGIIHNQPIELIVR